ncbi:E3 ubiquitin-protein ligase NEDD4, partial [Bienertia sinuspersici]
RKKGERKKKRVRFAKKIVDPIGGNEEFRRQHSNNLRKIIKVENRGLMPANRATFYNGILRLQLGSIGSCGFLFGGLWVQFGGGDGCGFGWVMGSRMV